jgi:hypothetical protein
LIPNPVDCDLTAPASAASEDSAVSREDTNRKTEVATGHVADGAGTDVLASAGIGPAADNTSVQADTGEQTQHERATDPARFAYTPEERTAIDQANEAVTAVIEAADTFEKIESWVPPLVRGVRALRDRAKREKGALNYLDHEYRKRFGDLLNAEPIGAWLLDENRHALLDAVHYLGSDDAYLDTFIEWRATKITEKQRHKWRSLRTLVEHFKQWQTGIVPSNDRRTADQKQIELVRTEGHKADAARLSEVAQARQELATGTIKTTETLWAILRQAGPEMVLQTLREHDAKDYLLTLIQLANPWLNEPS